MAVELRPEERRRPLEHLVGAPQLPVLLLELFHPLSFDAAHSRGDAVVDIGLLHPHPHRLDTVTELRRDPLDRPLRDAELSPQRPHHPHRGGLLLDRVPTRRRLPIRQFLRHDSILVSKVRSLQQTQGASTVIVEHLAYDALEDRFDSAIFTENQTAQDFSKAGSKLKKHVYDYVVTDSKIEREFVTELDTSHEVAVYAKLPRGFFIPTPVGDYNPDWAIAFRDDATKIKHVYFVAETKGSMSTLQLKGVENAKIDCARKFFASLNHKAEHDGVKYDVVDSYDSLLQLVGA